MRGSVSPAPPSLLEKTRNIVGFSSRPPGWPKRWTVHPPSRPVPGARPPWRDSCSVLPWRLKVTA